MIFTAKELGVSSRAVSKACRRRTPLNGYEVCVADLQQPTLSGEVWKPMLCPMSGTEISGRMVSSLGRLNLRRSGHIHSGCLRKDGYLVTMYVSSGGRRSESVHRLVAFAYLGPPPSSEQTHVNHKDGDKQNNAAHNLEYVTPAENRAHYLGNRTARLQAGCRSGSKPVWSRRYNSNDRWTLHPSMLRAAKLLDLNAGHISDCIHGKQRQTGGYEFQAADVFQSLPGEDWREVDVPALMEEKRKRMQASWAKPAA